MEGELVSFYNNKEDEKVKASVDKLLEDNVGIQVYSKIIISWSIQDYFMFIHLL